MINKQTNMTIQKVPLSRYLLGSKIKYGILWLFHFDPGDFLHLLAGGGGGGGGKLLVLIKLVVFHIVENI